jgi:hypothetical protein
MNFSTLSSNEKLAVYGSIAAIVGVLIASFLAGLAWVTLLAGIAMLVVIFLPQLSAGTPLPGKKGSLMFLVGLIAGVPAVLALLTTVTQLGAYLEIWAVQTLFLLLGVAGGLIMAWAGWQEFQAEGGSFQLGSSGTASPSAPVTRPPLDSTPSSGMGPSSTASTGMGSSAPPASSVGSTDMGSEGGPAVRRDDEDSLRNP